MSEELSKEFVLKEFKENGSYLSNPEDFSKDKLCNETPEKIRDSILNGNNDVEDTLKALEEWDKKRKGIK